MEITLLAFAQAGDVLGFSSRVVDCLESETPRDLLHRIAPDAGTADWRVAVDGEFAPWDAPLGKASELAFLPPVSGG